MKLRELTEEEKESLNNKLIDEIKEFLFFNLIYFTYKLLFLK